MQRFQDKQVYVFWCVSLVQISEDMELEARIVAVTQMSDFCHFIAVSYALLLNLKLSGKGTLTSSGSLGRI